MADEMGQAQFTNLLRTRALDTALPRLMADASAPWWDNRLTAATESRADIVLAAWKNTLAHLEKLYGKNPADWTWGRAHTLTHVHPLGRQAPLDLLFNTRTLAVPGGRETPNNLSYPLGPAPWAVIYGPSTRRVIDFADASRAVGITPVGQSGVWLDPHANDQVALFAQGAYVAQHLSPADVRAHTKSTLSLRPPR